MPVGRLRPFEKEYLLVGDVPLGFPAWSCLERGLDAVRDLLRAAESGGGGILLVQGERGSGRSRLLRQAAEVAGARGFSLIDPVVDGLGRSTPFAPLLPMLAGAPVGPAEPA